MGPARALMRSGELKGQRIATEATATMSLVMQGPMQSNHKRVVTIHPLGL
jgi:hypothetical protein